MTVDDRLLGQLIEKVDGVKAGVDNLRNDVKAISTNCPNCTNTQAVHTVEIANMKRSIDVIWDRLWQVGLAAAAAGGLAAYLIKIL